MGKGSTIVAIVALIIGMGASGFIVYDQVITPLHPTHLKTIL
jgi:hypothetical protein